MFFDLTEKEIEEASSAGKPKPSGIYDVKISFIARYDSPGSDSKGFYIEGELEDGFKYSQYINFIKKDGGANKFGQTDINALFIAIGLRDTAKPSAESYQIKMWGSERAGFPIKEAGGLMAKLMLRDTEEIGDDGVLRNNLIMEGAICKDGRTGLETLKAVDPKDMDEVKKWQAKIDKQPTKGAKKAKAKTATEASNDSAVKGWGK